MTADVTREPTGGQELREAIRLALAQWAVVPLSHLGCIADAVLALPELAALIADAGNWRRATTGDPTQPEPLAMQARTLLLRVRELEATVTRVRKLLYAGREKYILRTELARALDGEPQP